MPLLLPSEIAKLAEAGGKTHAEAMKILKKENPDWPEGDLADAANSVSPSMGADARRVQKRYQALTKSASTESPMMLPSELARLGKFPAGVSMTIDEVAAVVGDSFKEMNENPPDSVVKLREEMMDKTAASGLEREILEAMEHLTDIGDVPIKQADLMKSLGLNASEKSGFVKALQALVDSGDLKLGTKGYAKTARYEEGPEGAKQFDAWMAKQPKEVQDDWKKYTDENGDKFKTAGRFPPETDEGWDRLGYELLEQDDDMQQYWWKNGELYFVNLGAYEEDVYEYSEKVDLAAAKAIARKGQGQRDDGFQKMGAADAKRKPDMEAIKKLEGVVSVKMTPKREIVVVVENDIGNMASKYLTDKIAPILDQWDVDDSGFYRSSEDIPKGKKNQFVYTLKSGIGSKTARFEEGQPADPTKEMSPEDAKKWEGNTEKYKDKFTADEAMMDKFQGQLLPSESFSLMAAKTRHRSTWKNAEVEDDIGKKVKGPEEADKDEPYMKGQFTQVENSELSGKVAAEAYAEGSRVKQDGGKEGTVTKAKMVEGKQMYEVKWDGASISVDRKHADLKPVKTAGQKIYGHLVWLE